MKEIPLPNGLVALVDDSDFDWISKHKWHASLKKAGYPYAARRPYVGLVNGEKKYLKKVIMHREIMNAPEGSFVDHINGNTLDNRRCNLRVTTPQQNCFNSRKQGSWGGRPTRSKYKGVVVQIVAHIRVDNRLIYLGTFDDELSAALAYDEAARIHHGIHACLNFPLEGEQSAAR